MTITIVTSDKREFLVSTEIAGKSGIISKLLDSVDDGDLTVPLQDIQSPTLERVLSFLETDVFEAPDAHGDLLALVVAANFMDVKTLLDASCQEVAARIKGKSPEEIRAIFGLESTYTPEEEAKVRQANAWAFE